MHRRVLHSLMVGISLSSLVACAASNSSGGSPDSNSSSTGSGGTSGVGGASGVGGVGGAMSTSAGTGGEGGAGGMMGAGGTGGMTGTGGTMGTGGAMAVCGNMSVETGEQCDDGNTMSGDGCDANCQLEAVSADDVCPGVPIMLTGSGSDPRIGSVSGATTTLLNHYGGSCGGSGLDAVYVIVPDVTGQATVSLTADYDAVLYARSVCDDISSELACDDAPTLMGGEKISFKVTPNQPYYIIVDGYGGSAGTFTVDIQIDTAFCGNGIAEAPEQCDDGALVDGDGCSSTCEIEPGGILDDCPGESFFVSDGYKVSILGDTTNLTNKQYASTPCYSSGNEAIYAFTPDADGSLIVNMVAEYDSGTLFIRSECDTSSTQMACYEVNDPLVPIYSTIPVLANQTYYVFADSQSSSYKGAFKLDVAFSAAACGNHALDPNEECDDGNTVAGDGCDPTCLLEPPPADLDTCPGHALPLSGMPERAVITGSTATMVSNYYGSCMSSSSGAKDVVYSITPSIDGLATVIGRAAYDIALYARKNCTSTLSADSAACADVNDGFSDETIRFPVLAGNTYWVFADSYSSSQSGLYELTVEVTPGMCGNGVLEGNETCDDGNATAGDGCDPSCQTEPPGPKDSCPGEILQLTQQGVNYVGSVSSGTANLANSFSLTGCSSSGRDAVFEVVAPIDGVLKANVPTADFNVSLGARLTCTSSTSQITCSNVNTSGNGAESITFPVSQGTSYYIIVDSTSSLYYGLFQLDVVIEPPGCGDHQLSLGEECDDGNTINGDGCDSSCKLEPLAGNDTCPGYPVMLTGTGMDPRLGIITSDTTGLVSNYGGTCGGNARDSVYVVTPDINGTLTATLDASYAATIYARITCNDAASELSCDKTSPYEVTLPVFANTPYFIFVDGYGGAFGPSTLHITVTP